MDRPLFLLTTTQRCGSTWVARMLNRTLGQPCTYINCSRLGFELVRASSPGAVERLRDELRRRGPGGALKTHDIGARDFDTICEEIPELRVLTVRRDFRDVFVSRYFYYRYYWPTDPALGPLPTRLEDFFREQANADDHDTLARLADHDITLTWAREWAAFEAPFTTARAIRLTFSGLLDGTEQARLGAFVGLSPAPVASFEEVQRQETVDSGRVGMSRFNRDGTVGGWRKWLEEPAGLKLDELAQRQLERAGVVAAMAAVSQAG